MAQLIDTTYFVGEISLPARVLTGDFADISPFIVKYEREALIELIGYTLYKQLKVEIDAASYTTKWDRLVNGHEYTIDYLGDSHLVKWNGLINSELDSLLAYYIYYRYVQYHITHTSSVGEVLNLTENSARISASQKMVDAWNKFVDLRGLPNDQEINPTAYNFLNEFEDDETNGYDPWLFEVIRTTNTFGL
ncbi:hypothetical protein KAR91_37435 [Candidatus Pacearchaeota archaeon]|nr:hypothetical protein [Candidatus Pacearchaeota archaeon]